MPGRQHIIGTWFENPALLKPRPGSATLTTNGANRRQLEFCSDGTFQLTICDPDGQPLDPPQFARGTWQAHGQTVVFEVKHSRLDASHVRWAPDRFVRLRLGDGGDQPDYLDVRGLDGIRVRYTRFVPDVDF